MPLLQRLCPALILCVIAQTAAAQPAPTDVVTVGTNSAAAGAAVDVPVYIRDTSGTPLGIDKPSGDRIQAYTIRVDYAPASAVQSVTFVRAGITAGLTPTFESSPAGSGTISLTDTFSESTDLIPFTLDAALPGDQVAVLHFVIAASASPGAITLTLDPTLTQLENQSGTVSETVTSANLTLVSGSITVTPTTSVRLQSFDVE